MVIQILTSVEDNSAYHYNMGYLRKAMERGDVRSEAEPYNYDPDEFEFNKRNVYDFTRTAQRDIRLALVTFLSEPQVLPGLQSADKDVIREIFDCLFSYQKYKFALQQVSNSKQVSMNMLIFNGGNGNPEQDREQDIQRYVACVSFLSTSRKTSDLQFKVDVKLSCQRLTYFDAKDEDFDGFLRAMESLHVWNIQPKRVTAKDDGQIQN